MNKTAKDILTGHAIGLWVIVIVVMLILGGLAVSQVVLPWRESIRRSVYEESLAFVRGKNQRLLQVCTDFRGADSAHKEGLRRLFIHESAELSEDKMIPDVLRCKGEIF